MIVGYSRSAAVPTLSYIAHVKQSNSGANITLMSGIVAGDLLVFVDWGINGSSSSVPGYSIPSGWTDLGGATFSSNDGSGRVRAAAKIAGGSENGATIAMVANAGSDKKIVLQYRYGRPLTSFALGAIDYHFTGGNPSPRTLYATNAIGPNLCIMAYRSYELVVDPRIVSVTPSREIDIGDNGLAYVQDFIQNALPFVDVTFDMNDEGSANGLFGFWLHNFQ